MDNHYNYYTPDQPEDIVDEVTNSEQGKQRKLKRKMPKLVSTICLGLVFGVVGSAAFVTSNIVADRVFGLSKTTENSKTVANTQVSPTSSKTPASSVSDIVANSMPSVVSITSMSVQQVQNFFGNISEQEVQSGGSGIIIGQNDTELLIVTNNHVVADSNTLTVSFVDNESVEAQIKGTEASNDLAVIAVKLEDIKSETMDAIKVATLGDSEKIQVGDQAIAIGNALGYGQSVTTGIISAKDRSITVEGLSMNVMQTDAAINSGNSGGALLNANGEVIGINSAKVSSSISDGIGYAIPISDVTDIINNLMNKETRAKVAENEKGYLGIKGVDVTSESSQMYNMPTGVYVSESTDGGGAKKAGISKGSIITEVDGTTINSMSSLQELLGYYSAGETITVKAQVPTNNGEYKEETFEVTLTAQL